MKHILDLKNEPITPDKILEIHRLITNGTLGKPNMKAISKKITILRFIPRPGLCFTNLRIYKIPKLIDDLCNFANNKEEVFIHPVIKGVIIHFLIGYIHPFNDGNGRTARALFYWYLLKNDYWLFEYTAVSRVINYSKKQYRNAYLYTESDRTPE